MTVITISRQTGSLGDEIARLLSKKLDWELLTREMAVTKILAEIAGPDEIQLLNVSAKEYLKPSKKDVTYLEYLKNGIKEYILERSVILLGFGSQLMLADHPDSLHLRIKAPQDMRISRIKRRFNVEQQEAEEIISYSDRRHKRFVSTVYNMDLNDDRLYHLTLNTADLSVEVCTNVIIALLNEHRSGRRTENRITDDNVINNHVDHPILKNPSEIEFAKILDMYQIEWAYEPKTFPIEWDAEGNISMAFSPDFYLTRFDTYIELTTMDQKYITKKNKKMKRLQELYPGINIKLVKKKDYELLIERFRSNKGE